MGDSYQGHFAWNKRQWAETECSGIPWGAWFTNDYYTIEYTFGGSYGDSNGGTMSCAAVIRGDHPVDKPFVQCIMPDPNKCNADHVGWTNYGLLVRAYNRVVGMQCNPGGFGKKTNFVCMRKTQDQGPNACAKFLIEYNNNAMVVTYH